MNHDETFRKAREAYGLDFEIDMLQEECAEVILACCKMKRFPSEESLKEFFEEIADVENLFEQMKRWFPSMREYVDEKRNEKMVRLAQRIEDHYEHEDL
jgi:hypothetical protein